MASICYGPLFKQGFVTCGVSLNFLTHGLVVGFSTVMLPQLRETTDIDESTATWIASVIGISLLLGTLAVPIVMNTYGRKPAHIFSAGLMTLGWLIITVSGKASSLLTARFLQGFSMGILADMGNVLIGEYCSPKNRGAFLATISFFLILGLFIVHWLGTVVSSFQSLALVFACIAFVDLVIILLSPELPSFYAMKGKYEECRKSFHWLRGDDEEEELEKLIKINMAKQTARVFSDKSISSKVRRQVLYFKNTMKKREVYIPVIIMSHLYGTAQWGGGVTFDTYARDILDVVLGKDVNFPVIIVSLDLQRLISNALGIIFVKMCRRKLVLAVAVSINVLGYLSIALYVFLKTHDLLSYDHVFIGVLLVHIYLFSGVVGVIPVPNIIAGEIFPLEHRGLCGMLGIIFFSINETINIKSARYLFASMGVHGAFTIYGILVAYYATVAYLLLPETKDRVLLDIEEEFRGKPLITESKLIVDDIENETVLNT